MYKLYDCIAEILRPGFVYTRDLNGGELYSAVTEDSPIYAVDCEMVLMMYIICFHHSVVFRAAFTVFSRV